MSDPQTRLEILKLVMRPGIAPDEAIAMATMLEAWVCLVQAVKAEDAGEPAPAKRKYVRKVKMPGGYLSDAA